MNIFDGIEKLITEHGSAAILNQQLAFAKEQFSYLERQVSDLQIKIGKLEAQLEREQLDHTKAHEELQRLKDEHAEEILIHNGIEFRRGTRTKNQWIAFCPRCHTPAGANPAFIACGDSKCGWTTFVAAKKLPEIISGL